MMLYQLPQAGGKTLSNEKYVVGVVRTKSKRMRPSCCTSLRSWFQSIGATMGKAILGSPAIFRKIPVDPPRMIAAALLQRAKSLAFIGHSLLVPLNWALLMPHPRV